jgi:hypothetical protein
MASAEHLDEPLPAVVRIVELVAKRGEGGLNCG